MNYFCIPIPTIKTILIILRYPKSMQNKNMLVKFVSQNIRLKVTVPTDNPVAKISKHCYDAGMV